MVSISGASNTQQIATTAWGQGSKFLEQAGLDPKFSTQIGNMLNGNSDGFLTGATDGIIDGITSDPVANAAIKGAVDIVKTVLMGSYNKGEDVKAAANDQAFTQNLQTASNATSDACLNESKEQVDDATAVAVENGEIIEATAEEVSATIDEAGATIEGLSSQNADEAEQIAENQELIQQNQGEIQEKEEQQREIGAKIQERRAELGQSSAPAPAPAPAPTPAPDGEGGVSAPSNPTPAPAPQMSSSGAVDAEIQNLITEFNALGADISGLQGQNTQLQTDNASRTATIQQNIQTQQETIQTTTDAADQSMATAEEAANNILGAVNQAQGAVKEIQNFMNGQAPKFDKVAMVKMGTSMAKSAICGTNSGLLASAAAAMGVSSVVSFGSTAQKAAELTSASIDQGAGAAAHIAANVAEKMIEQQMKQYMSQTISQISQMTGVDLSELNNQFSEIINVSRSNMQTKVEQFKETTAPIMEQEVPPEDPPAEA